MKFFLRRIPLRVLGSRWLAERRLSRITAAGAVVILNLHRITESSSRATGALGAAWFREFLRWLKDRFRIVSFRELDELPFAGNPPLILSFDDGYREFIDTVVPILAEYQIKVNMNIVPQCVETGLPPFNVMVKEFIASAPSELLREICFFGLPGSVDLANRQKCGTLVSNMVKWLPMARQKDLYAEYNRQFARFDGFRTTPMMNLENIREVAAIHEIGAHSFEHASMSAESSDYFATDVARCQEWFLSNLSTIPEIYAFPNGATRAGQAEYARDAGFPVVLLTGESFSRRDTWLHPRFTFHAKTIAEARFRAVGGLVWLRKARLHH